jgi:hypothetical protein
MQVRSCFLIEIFADSGFPNHYSLSHYGRVAFSLRKSHLAQIWQGRMKFGKPL